MILMSMGMGFRDPSLSMCRSSITRRTLACMLRGMSAISSKNRVPRQAISIFPIRFPTPVATPFSIPNISLSKRASGTAAQLMAMKGMSLRRLP